jgi:NAD(P)-dependent dehydrogenase (short-subunit alcohol dehydrogenase family)
MEPNASARFDLTGRTALITGAAGMLGREHAAALLEVGALVVLTDVDEERLQVALRELAELFEEPKVLAKRMDVTEPESIRSVVQSLDEEGLAVEILVNNAAIDAVPGSTTLDGDTRLETFRVERWNSEIAVGLTGAFLCSQVFGTMMAKAELPGVILNIASDLAIIAPDQRIYYRAEGDAASQPVKPISYSVVKAGLLGLTRYLSTYWLDSAIRVNALSPGGVQVDQDIEFLERLRTLVPLGRMAQPDEYRSAVQFLCSDASAFMTGHNLVVDGGRSVW